MPFRRTRPSNATVVKAKSGGRPWLDRVRRCRRYSGPLGRCYFSRAHSTNVFDMLLASRRRPFSSPVVPIVCAQFVNRPSDREEVASGLVLPLSGVVWLSLELSRRGWAGEWVRLVEHLEGAFIGRTVAPRLGNIAESLFVRKS